MVDNMKKSESGVVMIEAIYVVVISIFVIFFTMNVGIMYHNRIVLTSVANEAANGVAEVYGSTSKEPFYNFTEYDYFKSRDVYRYLFNGKNELDTMAKQKAKWYASYLVYENEFSTDKSLDFSDIVVDCKKKWHKYADINCNDKSKISCIYNKSHVFLGIKSGV